MSTRGFTDKSMQLEAHFGGWGFNRRAFAEPGVEDHFAPDRGVDILAYALELSLGIPPRWGYLVCALVVIPLVTHGVSAISRLQLWTQPLW